MIRVAINGAAGRMGRRLVALVAQEKGLSLVAALEQAGHPSIGQDAGELAGCGKLNVALSHDWPRPSDVLIDFSSPAASMERAAEAASKRCAIVIGTTGLNPAQKKKLEALAKKIPVLISPNMSVGVNLLFKLAGEVAAKLGPEYDIEIVEMHHRMKKDAPSGTALRIAESIAAATKGKLDDDAVFGRHGKDAARKPGEIGIHTVRGGDVVGDHTVIFSGPAERIELTHRADSRDIFVRGAIRAARFIAGKKPGLYSMADVLNLSKPK